MELHTYKKWSLEMFCLHVIDPEIQGYSTGTYRRFCKEMAVDVRLIKTPQTQQM